MQVKHVVVAILVIGAGIVVGLKVGRMVVNVLPAKATAA